MTSRPISQRKKLIVIKFWETKTENIEIICLWLAIIVTRKTTDYKTFFHNWVQNKCIRKQLLWKALTPGMTSYAVKF